LKFFLFSSKTYFWPLMESKIHKYIWKSFVEGDSKVFSDLYELYAEDLFIIFKIPFFSVMVIR